MDDFIKGLGLALVAAGGIFLFVILGTCLGAVAGWLVGLVFSDTILGILDQLNIRGIAMWEFGAFMGFVGGFLKTKTTVSAS